MSNSFLLVCYDYNAVVMAENLMMHVTNLNWIITLYITEWSKEANCFGKHIPEELKSINKLNSFKYHLKSHLFNDIKY